MEIPEGKCGDWRVQRFIVSERDATFSALRAAINPRERGRSVPAGTYTRLTRDGVVVMSNTPAEIHDHSTPIWRAKGRVLVVGLGLGVVLGEMLEKDEVEHVLVVEKSADVIELVGKHFEGHYNGRVTIVNEDIFEFKVAKDAYWDLVWVDVWDTICADNLAQITKLKRRFPPRKCGWRGFWCENECRYAKQNPWG